MITRDARAGFRDRREAGRFLAQQLGDYADRSDVLVLALPRGGVPVAYEVATWLHAPLDIFLVRKIGMPGHEELALGAVASGGITVWNEDMLRAMWIPPDLLESLRARELRELERRDALYRADLPPPNVTGRTVILIDDGLATGATMRAAVAALRVAGAARIVVAVPVGSREACEEFRAEVDQTVCGIMPEPFLGVGRWYGDFSQTSDDEVRESLSHAREWSNSGDTSGLASSLERT